jgi:nucleotide-binding universal stress UspA family protein
LSSGSTAPPERAKRSAGRSASPERAGAGRARLDVRLHRGSIEGDPYLGDPLGWYTTGLGIDLSDLHRAAEDLLERALADVGEDVEDVEIEHQVVQGSAAEALVAAAARGDLLVVGSRGHGDFAGLLLGSVSQKCVHHVSCPVVVVWSSHALVDIC